MANAARKARKRSGEKFQKAPKVGTPLEDRTIRIVNKRGSFGLDVGPSNRHKKQIQSAIAIRDLDKVSETQEA